MDKRGQESGLWVRRVAARSAGRILYIHGLGESGLCFDRLLQERPLPGWEQVVPDLPGYGRSEWTSSPSTLEELADLLLPFLATDGRPNVLVGHSMGGVIGQVMCEKAGASISGFVNVEGNLTLDDCTFSGPTSQQSLDDFLSRGFDELKTGILQGAIVERALRTYAAGMHFCDPRAFYLNSRELVQLSSENSLLDRMEALPQPRLYVIGLRGRSQFNSVGRLRQSSVPSVEFPDSGHWPFIDETKAFARVMDGFLLENFGAAT